MNIKARRKRVLAAIALVGFLSFLSTLPAKAYNYYNLGYLPFALTSALPYSLGYGYSRGSYLSYPLRNLLYMPYNYVPYAINNLARGNSNQQTISYQYGYRGNVFSPMYSQQYQDPEPILGGRQRTRPVRSNQTADQIAYANFLPPGAQPPAAPAVTAPGSTVPGALAQPAQMGLQNQPMQPLAMAPNVVPTAGVNQNPSDFETPISHSKKMPPKAPKLARGHKTVGSISAGSPLAAGFVNTVNEKFGGDISKALFDPETRSWASAIHLVDGDTIFDADFSPACVEVVKKIMQDKNVDPASKLETVKAILRSSAASK